VTFSLFTIRVPAVVVFAALVTVGIWVFHRLTRP
jgi:hypothetical protein